MKIEKELIAAIRAACRQQPVVDRHVDRKLREKAAQDFLRKNPDLKAKLVKLVKLNTKLEKQLHAAQEKMRAFTCKYSGILVTNCQHRFKLLFNHARITSHDPDNGRTFHEARPQMTTMKSDATIPQIVRAWVATHHGSRTPCHSPGDFSRFSKSRTSGCWGQPLGGVKIDGGYTVAVCQPSPQSKGDPAWFLWDFKKV